MVPSLRMRARVAAQATVRETLKPDRVQAPNGVPAPERLTNSDLASVSGKPRKTDGLPSLWKALARYKNGYAESFHSRLRDEFLAIEEFESLTAARRLSTLWQDDYNLNRPHSSLEYQTPAEFAARCAASAPAPPALQQHSDLT